MLFVTIFYTAVGIVKGDLALAAVVTSKGSDPLMMMRGFTIPFY